MSELGHDIVPAVHRANTTVAMVGVGVSSPGMKAHSLYSKCAFPYNKSGTTVHKIVNSGCPQCAAQVYLLYRLDPLFVRGSKISRHRDMALKKLEFTDMLARSSYFRILHVTYSC